MQPLLGEHGLLPVPAFTKAVPFSSSPSLFFLAPNDQVFTTAAWAGVALYFSFVNVGQIFYAFGRESILLEATFYAIFLGNRRATPQTIGIWLPRWLLFRLMFGAGLIKMRGDPAGAISLSLWDAAHAGSAELLFNHLSELVVSFAYFFPAADGRDHHRLPRTHLRGW